MKHYAIDRYGPRHWAVYRPDGELLTVTVYKKGAIAVIEELLFLQTDWGRANVKTHIKSCLDAHAKARRAELAKERVRKPETIKIP